MRKVSTSRRVNSWRIQPRGPAGQGSMISINRNSGVNEIFGSGGSRNEASRLHPVIAHGNIGGYV